jgi:hypothetical protein
MSEMKAMAIDEMPVMGVDADRTNFHVMDKP